MRDPLAKPAESNDATRSFNLSLSLFRIGEEEVWVELELYSFQIYFSFSAFSNFGIETTRASKRGIS